MELEGVKYDAFISYRHCEPDSFVAETIHKRLENFKLPASVIKKCVPSRTRIERVFRDVEELPLSDNLSDPITNALENSDFLIVIATPRYLESRWCMKEVTTFLRMHGRDHILVVLAEGEPHDSFPEILTYHEFEQTDENGNTTLIREECEPLAADTRGANKREILKNMDVAVTKLCAAIFGLNYDDLKQRRREQKIKRIAAVASVVGAAILAFAVFATVSLLKISHQNRIISAQYDELEAKYAGSVADSSDKLLRSGRRADAIYAARSVLPDDPAGGFCAEALRRLTNALYTYDSPEDIVPFMTYDVDSAVDTFVTSTDDRYIAVADTGAAISVFDVDSGERLISIEREMESSFENFAFCGSEGLIYLSDDGSLEYVSLSTLEEHTVLEDLYDAAVISDHDPGYALCYSEGVLHSISGDGSISFSTDLSDETGSADATLAAYDFCDGCIALAVSDAFESCYMLVDADRGNLIESFSIDGFIQPAIAVDDGMAYIGFSDFEGPDTEIYAINTATAETIWVQQMSEYLNLKLLVSGDELYAWGANLILEYDRRSGTLINRFYLDDTPIMVYPDPEGGVSFISQKGGSYSVRAGNLYDKTYTYFPVPPEGYVASGDENSGTLYYAFSQANYVASYRSPEGLTTEKIDEKGESINSSKYSAEDVLDRISGIDVHLVRNAFYSDDKSFIMIDQNNSMVYVYNAEDLTLAGGPFETDFALYELVRINDDMYVASGRYKGYVLNGNFEIIAECCALIDHDEKGMTAYNASDSGLYRYGFISYEDIIAQADELLGEHTPKQYILDRYNLR